MATFSWRLLVCSAVTAGSLLFGNSHAAHASGASLFAVSLWGDCCGGSYGSGYFGGYYSGYAPAYDAYYDRYAAGYGGYGYGPSYGGYYAPGYGSYAPAYGGCSGCGPAYASSNGCSTCVGGGCEVSSPSTNPPRPKPDDYFRKAPEKDLRDNDPADRPSRRLRDEERPRDEAEVPTSKPLRGRTPPRNEGFTDPRDRTLTEPKSETEKSTFEQPLEPKSNRSDFNIDRFPNDAKKLPMPKDDEKEPEKTKTPDSDPDSFDINEETSTETKAEKPDLGPATDVDPSQPADAEAAGGTVIPQKKAAPVELPEEPAETTDPAPMPEIPTDLKLDDKPTAIGVSPKTRLALRGRFGTPSIVRLKLRPNTGWSPTPSAAVIAKH